MHMAHCGHQKIIDWGTGRQHNLVQLIYNVYGVATALVLFRVIQISQFMNADIKVVDEYSLLSTSQHLLQPDNI